MTPPEKATALPAKHSTSAPGEPPDGNMLWIPGGTFHMGVEDGYPDERPIHTVAVGGFWMDRYVVTNRQFQAFVAATDYTTVAERAPRAEDFPGAPPEN